MPTAPKSTQPGQGGDSKQRSISLRWIRESGMMTFLVACGLFTLLTTVLIIVVLSGEAYRFFTFNEVVVDRLGDDRLAGTFEQADDGWVFQIADEQRGRIAFVDAERARE
jgi:ABC-type phosphate transport system permease subunit